MREPNQPRLLFVAAALLLPATCAAQVRDTTHLPRIEISVSPGTRVRVTTLPSLAVDTSGRQLVRHVGRVVSSTPTDFEFVSESSRWTRVLAFSQVSQLDVSAGRKSRALAGGVLGGLLSGGAFVGTACAFSSGSCDIGSNAGGFLGYYAVGAIPGAIVGAVVGRRLHGAERWRTLWVNHTATAARQLR